MTIDERIAQLAIEVANLKMLIKFQSEKAVLAEIALEAIAKMSGHALEALKGNVE